MFVIRPIFFFAANLLALMAADYFVPGFQMASVPYQMLSAALLFTILNTYIRPVIKYVFTIFIVISFGLFSLVINAATLYILDFMTENININGLATLFYAAAVIAAANTMTGIIDALFLRQKK